MSAYQYILRSVLLPVLASTSCLVIAGCGALSFTGANARVISSIDLPCDDFCQIRTLPQGSLAILRTPSKGRSPVVDMYDLELQQHWSVEIAPEERSAIRPLLILGSDAAPTVIIESLDDDDRIVVEALELDPNDGHVTATHRLADDPRPRNDRTLTPFQALIARDSTHLILYRARLQWDEDESYVSAVIVESLVCDMQLENIRRHDARIPMPEGERYDDDIFSFGFVEPGLASDDHIYAFSSMSDRTIRVHRVNPFTGDYRPIDVAIAERGFGSGRIVFEAGAVGLRSDSLMTMTIVGRGEDQVDEDVPPSILLATLDVERGISQRTTTIVIDSAEDVTTTGLLALNPAGQSVVLLGQADNSGTVIGGRPIWIDAAVLGFDEHHQDRLVDRVTQIAQFSGQSVAADSRFAHLYYVSAPLTAMREYVLFHRIYDLNSGTVLHERPLVITGTETVPVGINFATGGVRYIDNDSMILGLQISTASRLHLLRLELAPNG